LSDVKQQLSSTKWRIPTLSDWREIIAESTDEKMAKIRSSANWNQTGGEGGVFPLGGAMSTRAGKTLYYDMESPAIYLAIDGTTAQVVVMRENPETHKFGFEIISTPSAPNGSLNYISILCVSDAIKVTDPITKYKLGYDSYALMEGSVSAGTHNFNASENSIITESAHYNSIFGGMNNTIDNSSHNTVLNGFNNQLMGAVFATVCGNNNLLQLDSDNAAVCNTLMVARNSVARGCLTSLIATENSEIDSTKIGSVLGNNIRINGASVCWCSRISADGSEFTREVKCSDVLAHSAYHIPQLYMTRATVSNVSIPNVKGFDDGTGVLNCSDFIGYNVWFFAKQSEDQSAITDARTLFCSRMAGQSSGLIKAKAILSDVYTQFDGSGWDSRFKYRTLESVSIYESSIKLCNSTIGSNYIDNPVDSGRISFCDISLCSSIMLLTTEGATGTTKDIAFGVMKLANSCIELSDCAYIYDVGDNHCLSNSNIRYATLVGKTITLTSSSFQNLHLYGSLTLSTSLANHLILSGLDGTNVGNGFAASNYISEFGSYIVANDHGYPMIWSLGGVGMYMNKMILGNCGVSGASEPHIGDVLTVVGVEGNLATVAWMPGGTNGKFGTINLEVTFKCANTGWAQGAGGEYAMNLWALRDTSRADCVVLNGENIPNSGNVVETMNGRLGNSDIKFKVENGLLALENTGSDTYTISGSAACVEVSRTNVDEPTSSSYGWNMWDTDDFIPMPLGHYSAALNTNSNVGANGTYDDMLRYLILGFKTSDDAQGAGELCGVTLAEDQELVCKYSVNINYRKS
jgi:hypothetical protein